MGISELLFKAGVAYAQSSATSVDSDVSELWDLVIDFYYRLILPGATILAGLVIFYAGIIYATADGSDESVKKAKTLISGALSGLALVLLASFLIQYIGG